MTTISNEGQDKGLNTAGNAGTQSGENTKLTTDELFFLFKVLHTAGHEDIFKKIVVLNS